MLKPTLKSASPIATKKPKPPKVVVAPICPKCGNEAMTVGSAFGPKHVCCDLWSYDGRPLVNGATHRARIAAHDFFDLLWKEGHVSRTEAYALLAREMSMRRDECHFANMSYDQLGKAIRAIGWIRLHVIPNRNEQAAYREN